MSLLAEVNRRAVVWGRTGVPLEKLLDCYPNAITDVRELVRTGRYYARTHGWGERGWGGGD